MFQNSLLETIQASAAVYTSSTLKDLYNTASVPSDTMGKQENLQEIESYGKPLDHWECALMSNDGPRESSSVSSLSCLMK